MNSTIKTMKEGKNKKSECAFTKKNYILLGIGVIFIIAGVFAMQGGKMEDRSMFDFQRITLAPMLIMAGFIINVFAILHSPKGE